MNYYYIVGKFLPYIKDQCVLEFKVQYHYEGFLKKSIAGGSWIISSDESLLTYVFLTYGLHLLIINDEEFTHLHRECRLYLDEKRMREEFSFFRYMELYHK
jgi:hypothetical protein